MKKLLILLLVAVLLTGCSIMDPDSPWNQLPEGAEASVELPDGRILTLGADSGLNRVLSGLALEATDLTAPQEGWVYRIVFRPAGKALEGSETVVTFFRDCVQIGDRVYRAAANVDLSKVLEWLKPRYNFFY